LSLISTGESTPAGLSPVLGSPVQERHGHTGAAPAKVELVLDWSTVCLRRG